MNSQNEIELKFKADGVDFKVFNEYMLKAHFAKRIHAACPDIYYTRDDNVVRHRLSEGAGELTVKQRKSDDQIKDRLEIDLKFAEGIKKQDVSAFLAATGWDVCFELDKDSYIYYCTRPETKIEAVLAYYTVGTDQDNIRTFIEVEIEKGNKITKREALVELNWWKKELQFRMGLGEPLNQSLYEIYSGKKYKIC